MRHRRTGTAIALVCAAVVLAGCTGESGVFEAAAPAAAVPGVTPATQVQQAQEVLQVSTPHEQTGMTLLEGPVFDPDGKLVLVDVTAPAGQPKVLRVDLETKTVGPVFSADNAAYTSAQISPSDGRLYLTDLVGGRIDSITLDGQDARTVFAGAVDGEVMLPDDLTFDDAGNLYVSDTAGHDEPFGPPRGRVVRIDPVEGSALVLAAGLPAPNGISFGADTDGLYVSQYTANRIDYLALTPDGRQVRAAHPAVHVDTGAAQIDSSAIDADGNLYQGLHGQPRIQVFDPHGQHVATIEAPVPDDGAYSATNLAIRPSTTEAVMTVSGPSGGYLHSFTALAAGTRQSNGG